MADHAILSPSSAKRWLACTPSARFEEQFPSSTSVYAEEGTLAHKISECLLQIRLGKLPDDDRWLAFATQDPLYSPEMLTHCEQYADYCMSKVHPDSIVDVETRLDMTGWIPEGFGTGDFMAYTRSLRLLEFTDLKYGKGVPVSAVDNPQLKVYALGAYSWYRWVYGEDVCIDTIKVNIYQPRLGAPSEWSISLADLLQWAETVLKPQALKAFAGEGEYVVGDWCKFCRARFRCKAFEDRMTDIFDHALQERAMLDDAAIVRILERAPLLISWLNDLSDYALAEAVKGKQWAGMKLVEGKSNRVFADAGATEVKLQQAGYAGEIYTTPELLGVTKLKTVLGAKVFKELVEPDLRKPPGKPTLVSADDPRPDFDRASAVFRDVVLATEEE